MTNGNGGNPPTPTFDFARADNGRFWPVSPFNQHLRAQCRDQRKRRIGIEPRDEVDRTEGGNDRRAIRQRINRSALAFAQAFDVPVEEVEEYSPLPRRRTD